MIEIIGRRGDWKFALAGDWCVEHVATAVEIAAIAGIDEDVFDLAQNHRLILPKSPSSSETCSYEENEKRGGGGLQMSIEGGEHAEIFGSSAAIADFLNPCSHGENGEEEERKWRRGERKS